MRIWTSEKRLVITFQHFKKESRVFESFRLTGKKKIDPNDSGNQIELYSIRTCTA